MADSSATWYQKIGPNNRLVTTSLTLVKIRKKGINALHHNCLNSGHVQKSSHKIIIRRKSRVRLWRTKREKIQTITAGICNVERVHSKRKINEKVTVNLPWKAAAKGGEISEKTPRLTIHALTCGGACASHGNPDVRNYLVELICWSPSFWLWTHRPLPQWFLAKWAAVRPHAKRAWTSRSSWLIDDSSCSGEILACLSGTKWPACSSCSFDDAVRKSS